MEVRSGRNHSTLRRMLTGPSCVVVTGGIVAAVVLAAMLSSTGAPEPVPSGDNPAATRPADRPVVTVASLTEAMAKLKPLHTTIRKPGPGDWLAQHKEPGQTFAEYTRYRPVTPVGKRCVLYIQPLGKFTATQRKIIGLTAEFMELYFNTPVKVAKDLPLSVIPASARRTHPSWGVKQILSTYVLDSVLRPRLPDDAAAYIAFTASDLWPGAGWNFVFGQASLRHRVGVWSIHRNGDPDVNAAALRLCLLRTIKTAVHETGHMFSMLHCTAYECCMCGSNNRPESDARPVVLCPECVAKVCWATRTAPAGRYRKLARFCLANGLADSAKFYSASLAALGGKPVTAATTQPAP